MADTCDLVFNQSNGNGRNYEDDVPREVLLPLTIHEASEFERTHTQTEHGIDHWVA